MTDFDLVEIIKRNLSYAELEALAEDRVPRSVDAALARLVVRLMDRVAALEAERDRRESYEQEQNERR